MEKNRIIRRDEFPRRKLRPRLTTPRTDVAVLSFPVPQSHNDFEFSIQNANLAIQIRANHPFALRMKIAWHTHLRLVFDRLQMRTIQRVRMQSDGDK